MHGHSERGKRRGCDIDSLVSVKRKLYFPFYPYPFFFGAISIILNMSNAILQGFQRTLLAISR